MLPFGLRPDGLECCLGIKSLHHHGIATKIACWLSPRRLPGRGRA